MPDTFDTTQLFDRIILLSKVEEGRKQISNSETYTSGQAVRKLKKWLK